MQEHDELVTIAKQHNDALRDIAKYSLDKAAELRKRAQILETNAEAVYRYTANNDNTHMLSNEIVKANMAFLKMSDDEIPSALAEIERMIEELDSLKEIDEKNLTEHIKGRVISKNITFDEEIELWGKANELLRSHIDHYNRIELDVNTVKQLRIDKTKEWNARKSH